MAEGTRSVNIIEYIDPVARNLGVDMFYGGKDNVEIGKLEEHEILAVERCFKRGLRLIRKISDELAEILEQQESLFLKWAEVAKGQLDNKPIAYPAESGTIGVGWIFPQAVKYVATPSADEPAYTSYKNNTWEIDLSAGTSAYIFGDSTNDYRACPTSGQRCFMVIAQNGLVEIGSTPKIRLMRVTTQGASKYAYWPVHPLIEVPIEMNDEESMLYIYNTIGMIPVYHNYGIKWEIVPTYSGTSVLPLVGLVFYEYDFIMNKKYIS